MNEQIKRADIPAGSNEDDYQKQSTSKQFIVIVFILALATKMFLLPIYLIQSTGRDGYIVLAIEAGIDLITLALILITAKLSPDTDFFSLLRNALGTVGSKIIVGVFALFLFFKLNIAASETITFYSDSVFADFNIPYMIVVLLIFLGAVSNHTLRAIARLNELIVPIIVVGIAALIGIVLATGFDFANILPAMQQPKVFGEALLHHSAWIGDFTPLILFVGRTKLKKHTVTFAAVSGVIGCAVTVLFAIVMCAAFGNVPHLADSSTNISSILEYSMGNVYGRIDLISSILWSVAAFVETALFFYATCRCVAYVIGKNAHFLIGLGTCAVLYLMLVFAMTDTMVFTFTVTNTVTSIITPVLAVLIPLLALLCAIKGRKRNADSASGEKAEQEN